MPPNVVERILNLYPTIRPLGSSSQDIAITYDNNTTTLCI